MDRPLRVAVLGSCTTRDNFNSRFNPGYKSMWDCVLLQNQSSLLSVMAPPLDLPEERLGDLGKFTRSVVVSDLSKSFLQDVVDAAPDYLVMDFFADIHFGCLRVEGGTLVTDNRWHLWKSDYYQELKAADKLDHLLIQDDEETYLDLWRDAYDRLTAHLAEHLPDTRVVVHRGFNTNRVRVGEGGPDGEGGGSTVMPLRKFKRLRPLDVPRMNDLWARLDDYAASAPGVEQVDLTERGYTSYDEHPWGPFYVHYTMDYYRDFLAELNLIHLRRALSDGSTGPEGLMLEQVLAAQRHRAEDRLGRAVRRNDRLGRRVERLRGEVEAMRSESPLRALRRSIRRR